MISYNKYTVNVMLLLLLLLFECSDAKNMILSILIHIIELLKLWEIVLCEDKKKKRQKRVISISD